jgi:hypothetical protein
MKAWWKDNWIIPEEAECLFSHCPYGYLDKYNLGKTDHVTFLRDPIDRMVSLYYFSLQNITNPRCIGLALQNFISLIKCNYYSILDNGMVRLIAGRNDIGMTMPNGKVTEDDLERAKENLLTFSAIGTLDTFDEDLTKFAEKFGWEDIVYEKYRVGRRPPLEEIDPGFIEIIEDNNRYDQQLFDFAKEIKDKIN